jgi:hypothetical protein
MYEGNEGVFFTWTTYGRFGEPFGGGVIHFQDFMLCGVFWDENGIPVRIKRQSKGL